MKKPVLAAALAGVMLFSGCSGVSQDEYNSLLEANSQLTSQNEELSSKLNRQLSNNTSLSEENKKITEEYEQLKKDAEPYLKLSEAERSAEKKTLKNMTESTCGHRP